MPLVTFEIASLLHQPAGTSISALLSELVWSLGSGAEAIVWKNTYGSTKNK
jgi:hypothetical protein